MTLQSYDYDRPLAVVPSLSPEIDGWIARLEPAIRLTELTYSSELIPAAFRGRKGDVLAGFIRSGELRMSPFTGISQMHTINGRVGISAELMRALILREGHDLHIEVSTAQKCTIRGRRSTWDGDRWTTVSWTIEDAAKAGLLEDKRSAQGKVTPSMYKKWPAAMLLARATTTLARMVFPDVIAGLRSTEELQTEFEELEAAGYEPVQQPPTTTTVSRGAGQARAVESEAPNLGGSGEASAEGVGAASSEQRPAAPTPARKKPPLKKRGLAAVPDATAEVPSAESTAADVVDAVLAIGSALLGEEPESAPAQGSAHSPDHWRQKTMTQVQMQWVRILGQPVARDERIFWTGVLVGRPVESTNEISDEELASLLNVLGKLRNREALEAMNRTAGERDE